MSDHIVTNDSVARAGRAFRAGALTAAYCIAGALCIVGAYAAIVLLGRVLVAAINRIAP